MTTVAQLHHLGCLHDISVGSGFTVLNPAKIISSGPPPAVPIDFRDYLKQCVMIEEDPFGRPGKISWRALHIYTVHKISNPSGPAGVCAELPPLATIGEIRAIIPTMEQYQYQWTGQRYGWVPA
jgi:hypothetical protein